MEWFKRIKKPKFPRREQKKRVQTPEGIWVKCNKCKEIIYKKEVIKNLHVCPKCEYHFRLSGRDRLDLLLEEWSELDRGILATDPLEFEDTQAYKSRLEKYRDKTGLDDAVINVVGELSGIPVVASVMEYQFMGGSMGSVLGEKVTRSVERAMEDRKPLIVVSASGGARMQEGALSLMQMAKISAALARLDDAGLPYISILTDPTTGGVTASFAMLGDLNIAEPGALIGFAGPRVIEQTIKETLPEGFQTAEFLLEKGMLDAVVPRKEMKETIAGALRHFLSEIPVEGQEAELPF
jgi:acetyl-CoA carboxylase carboxyl transferase subunit beta